MSNVRRIKKRNFTATDNQLVRDNRLSWKARGIFNYLWSQSEEWNFYVEEVAKHSKDGIRALQSGLSELEKCGYLKRTMYHKDGKFNGMSWELSDTGDLTVNHKTCLTENAVDNKTCQTGKSTLRKNNNKKEQYTSKNKEKKDTMSSSHSTVSHADDYKTIIDYLNQKASTNYRSTSQKTQRLINARFNEGFSVDDFKKVIDIKVSQWSKDSKMSKYLRPETLFGTKFEGYLNEQPKNNNQYGASNVEWGW